MLISLEIVRDYANRYGEHCCKFSLQPNEYKNCYCVLPNNCSHTTFLKKSCSLGPARWFATKLHNSKCFWSTFMKFSGWACLDMKTICGKVRCKQTSIRKVIALAFIYVNPHLAYLVEWRIYASFRTLCIWTYDAYMRQSAPKVFIMTQYFVIRNFRGTCLSVKTLKGYMLIFRNSEGVRAHLSEC